VEKINSIHPFLFPPFFLTVTVVNESIALTSDFAKILSVLGNILGALWCFDDRGKSRDLKMSASDPLNLNRKPFFYHSSAGIQCTKVLNVETPFVRIGGVHPGHML
jgi:hypothetical protein